MRRSNSDVCKTQLADVSEFRFIFSSFQLKDPYVTSRAQCAGDSRVLLSDLVEWRAAVLSCLTRPKTCIKVYIPHYIVTCFTH